jgi:hypothetical protein
MKRTEKGSDKQVRRWIKGEILLSAFSENIIRLGYSFAYFLLKTIE